MPFETLGLTPELLRAVAAEGYTEPTPVQAQAIPHVLAGRDVMAGAQTGTGKTAAFVLPILQLLNAKRPSPRHPIRESGSRRGRSTGVRPKISSGLPVRCLVLTPTRELALQVEEFVQNYGREKPVRSAVVYGGVGYEAQFNAIEAGPEIVVATPGRLLDIVEQRKLDLRAVEILVLDEADRMLDMGFIKDIRRIIELLPPKRQNLMFSATFADDVRELSSTILRDPAQVQVARRNAAIDSVRQVVMPVDKHRKRELLTHLIESGRIDRALVFTRTKHLAGRLAEQLWRDGIAASAIHGNKTQGQRIQALDDFKEGRINILVATEVAARGLDIDGLPHVVNFELPTVAEDYIHRIGRTGRAGLQGDAVSLVSIDELDLLNDIETLLRRRIPDELVPGFEIDPRSRTEPVKPIRAGARGRGATSSYAEPRRSSASRAPSRGRSGPSRTIASSGPRRAPSTNGHSSANGHGPTNGNATASRPRSAPATGSGSFTVMPGERLARSS